MPPSSARVSLDADFPRVDSEPRVSSGSWQLGLGLGAAAVSEESQARAEAWRRNSVDAHLQRTTDMAAAKRLDATRSDRPDRSERPAPPASRAERWRAVREDRAAALRDDSSRAKKNLAPPNPLHVEAQALSVWVRPPRPPWWLPSSRRPVPMDVESADAHPGMLPILRGVSFVARPGEVLAVMGPSGSGKTSLVAAVAGRLRGGGDYAVDGDVLIGGVRRDCLRGRPERRRKEQRRREGVHFPSSDFSSSSTKAPSPSPPASFARDVGFVTQDECLFPNLTVAETIDFAAALRLPDALYTRPEKRLAALECRAKLGLEAVAKTRVGSPFGFPRGVSGGERKRVSVACELVSDPRVLLLDEPTSGLDSAIALKLANLLRRDLALERRLTVVVTIHQPSSRVMGTFDALLLLAEGRRLFYGSVAGIAPYFERVASFRMPFGMNPGDFALDLAVGDPGSAANTRDGGERGENVNVEPEAIVGALAEASAGLRGRVGDDGEEAGEVLLAIERGGSPGDDLKGEKEDDDRLRGDEREFERRTPPRRSKHALPWHSEFWTLLRRSFAARRGQLLDELKLAQVLVVALIVGALWYDRGSAAGAAGVADVSGLLFFECLFLSFLTLFGSLFTFPDERQVALKERRSGVFRVSAYFAARSAADVPLDLFVPTLFLPIAYWLAGLRATAAAFVTHVLTVYLLVLVAGSMGLLLGACVTNVKRAQTLASVIMLAVMLTGGFYFDRAPGWLSWTKRASFINHAYAVLLKTQYPNGAFECDPTGVTAGGFEGPERIGAPGEGAGAATPPRKCSLRDAGLLTFVDLDEPAEVNVGALLAILVGMRALTYLALRFVSLRA